MIIRILALSLLLTSAAHAGPLGIPGTWTLVFNDNFDGTKLNRGKWTANWLGAPGSITPPVQPDNELAAYDPAQVTVRDGFARLTMISRPVTVNGQTYPYRSGMIQTHDKRHFTFGAFEARICLPAQGSKIANWPAWWTNGEHDGSGWPEDGENDIMEGLSGGAAWHYHAPGVNTGDTPDGFNGVGCHVYGSNWQAYRIDYYYDGVNVGSVTSGVLSAPHYLILNYATSSEHGGPLRVPSIMRIDYVRVWQ